VAVVREDKWLFGWMDRPSTWVRLLTYLFFFLGTVGAWVAFGMVYHDNGQLTEDVCNITAIVDMGSKSECLGNSRAKQVQAECLKCGSQTLAAYFPCVYVEYHAPLDDYFIDYYNASNPNQNADNNGFLPVFQFQVGYLKHCYVHDCSQGVFQVNRNPKWSYLLNLAVVLTCVMGFWMSASWLIKDFAK